jgi:hypothetical protein
LVFLSVAAALSIANRYDLGVAQTLVAVLVGGGAPAGLYLSWAAYRESRAGGDGLSLASVADELAAAVRAQWQTEAEVRRINDPYPLYVSWTAADVWLADTWQVLVRLAGTGAGWPMSRTPEAWAAGPEGLSGGGSDLVDVLGRVPTGRLVVLGEPGAGKSVLMVRLLLDLLVRRTKGGPVPVLVSLASWNPSAESFHNWLAAHLTADHPALATAAPSSASAGSSAAGPPTRIKALLEAALLLPILDGLDEISEPFRGLAIAHISDAIRPGEQLVMTCRTEQYGAAVRPSNGREVTLRGAAVVQLRPLAADVVSAYLRDDAGGPIAAVRWDPVVAALGTQTPVGQALTTPLMVGMARIIYNPRPGERAGDLRRPDELCDAALTDREEVERRLFDGFIPAAYRSGPGSRGIAQQAERKLVLLAHYLEYSVCSPDFAWWRLQSVIPAAVFSVASGIIFGLACGLVFGIGFGPIYGVIAGVVGSFVLALPPYEELSEPVRGVEWRHAGGAWLLGLSVGLVYVIGARDGVLFAVSVAVAIAVLFGFPAGISGMDRRDETRGFNRVLSFMAEGLTSAVGCLGYSLLLIAVPAGLVFGVVEGIAAGSLGRLTGGLALGIATGLTLDLLGNLVGGRGDLDAAPSPQATFADDRRATLVIALVSCVAFALTWAIAGWLVFGSVKAGVIGAITGVVAGSRSSIWKTAWPPYIFASVWLAMRHQLPWRLSSLLVDAHQRGVLRQVGAVYQFRHIELQRHLAAWPRHSPIDLVSASGHRKPVGWPRRDQRNAECRKCRGWPEDGGWPEAGGCRVPPLGVGKQDLFREDCFDDAVRLRAEAACHYSLQQENDR